MKSIIIFLFGCLLLGCSTIQETNSIVKESFKVYGNCNRCKTAIEGAVENLQGVVWGEWDLTSKTMRVKFDSSLISINEIQIKIAAVGYDSFNHRASDEVYNNLPGCCQYDRP